jgi:hypothetical protein
MCVLVPHNNNYDCGKCSKLCGGTEIVKKRSQFSKSMAGDDGGVMLIG